MGLKVGMPLLGVGLALLLWLAGCLLSETVIVNPPLGRILKNS